MRRVTKCTSLTAVFLGTAILVSAGEVKFSTGPAVAKPGDKVAVTFTISAPTDVEVAVLGADGKVVRHLAAGVLGAKNPPPEPLKPGLTQSLEWDGKDDLGKPCSESGGALLQGKPPAGGPFKFRVRAGMGAKFGRIFAGSPYTGLVYGLAADDKGTVYARLTSQCGGWATANSDIRQFDRDGKYLRQVLPYPPSTAPAKAAGMGLVEVGDGLTPVNRSTMYPEFCQFGSALYPRVVDGCLVFIDSAGARTTFFKLDGSNALKTVPMRSSPDKLKWPNWLIPQLAFSPDGKYAYYSNVANTPYAANVHPSKMDQQFPQGRVYRHDLTRPGSDPEKFHDLELPDYDKQKYWLPDAWNKRTAAYGVTVDAKGNVFMCDLVNQVIVELSPEGKKLGATKVPWPEKVLINNASGDLYVVSRLAQPKDGYVGRELVKIAGRGEGAKVVAKLPLKGELGDSLTLDDSQATPVLWLGGGAAMVRVEDRGASLMPGENLANRDKDAMTFVAGLAVDPEVDWIYVFDNGGGSSKTFRYNGVTGESLGAPLGALQVAIGRGGMIYAWGQGGYDGPICRYTRDLKPAPLASTGRNTYGSLGGRMGKGNNAGGIAVDLLGRVYAYHSIGGSWPAHVSAWDSDGKPVEVGRYLNWSGGGKAPDTKVPTLIGPVQDCGGAVRADAGGNVYVGQLGYPAGYQAPRGYEKDEVYLRSGGSVLKFGAKGGERLKGGGPDTVLGFTGVLRAYCGLSPMSGPLVPGSGCNCSRPFFDLDGYGRLYIPSAYTFKVSVRDNNDNEILRFGGYGNFEAQGPESKEPKPEIPLGWPVAAGASDRHIYVGDTLNHRVVRVDKTWAAEAACEIR